MNERTPRLNNEQAGSERASDAAVRQADQWQHSPAAASRARERAWSRCVCACLVTSWTHTWLVVLGMVSGATQLWGVRCAIRTWQELHLYDTCLLIIKSCIIGVTLCLVGVALH